MTDKEKQAFMILLQGLVNIKDRKFGPIFTVREYARNVLKLADDALNGTGKTISAPCVTLATDALAVTQDFVLAKQFVDHFKLKESDVDLTIVTELSDGVDTNKILYELTVKTKRHVDEMLEWLYENNCNAYTIHNTDVILYFEIVATVGTETAYLVRAGDDKLKRVK